MLLRWKSGPYPKEIHDGAGHCYQVDQVDGTVLGDVPMRAGTKMIGTGSYEAITEHRQVAELQEQLAKLVPLQAGPTIEECIQILVRAAQSSEDLAARLDAVFARRRDDDDQEGPVGHPGPEASIEQPGAPDERRSSEVPTPEPVALQLPEEEDPFAPSEESLEPAPALQEFNPMTATHEQRLAEAYRLSEFFRGQGRKPLFEIFQGRGMAVNMKDNQITMIGRLCGLEPGWDQQG